MVVGGGPGRWEGLRVRGRLGVCPGMGATRTLPPSFLTQCSERPSSVVCTAPPAGHAPRLPSGGRGTAVLAPLNGGRVRTEQGCRAVTATPSGKRNAVGGPDGDPMEPPLPQSDRTSCPRIRASTSRLGPMQTARHTHTHTHNFGILEMVADHILQLCRL